jgi:hypothetical protein
MSLTKRSQVKSIAEISRVVLGRKLTPQFSYGLAKNLAILRPELEGIEAAGKTLETYEKGRLSLCEKHAKKGADGKAVLNNGIYKMVDNDAFNSDLKKWREASKEYQDFQNFLDEEVDIKFHMIKLQDFPSEIEGLFVETLLPIIE